MTPKQTGGPAFACMGVKDGYGNIKGAQQGMTLRDYFAGQALAGMLAHPSRSGSFGSYADSAFVYADAMLKERDK